MNTRNAIFQSYASESLARMSLDDAYRARRRAPADACVAGKRWKHVRILRKLVAQLRASGRIAEVHDSVLFADASAYAIYNKLHPYNYSLRDLARTYGLNFGDSESADFATWYDKAKHDLKEEVAANRGS